MSLRIATWNIRKGGTGRQTLIADVLRALDADVVVLQEATNPAVLSMVARETGSAIMMSAPGRSVAILGRIPMDEVRWHPLPAGRKFLEASLPAAGVRLLGVHLSAGLSGRGERRRAVEMEALLAVAGGPAEAGRTMIAGDLNAIAPSDSPAISSLPLWIRVLLKADGGIGTKVVERALGVGFVDIFRSLHPDDPGLTLPADRPSVRLDYFLLGADLASAATTCEIGGADPQLLAVASDHLPLVVELDAAAPAADPGR